MFGLVLMAVFGQIGDLESYPTRFCTGAAGATSWNGQ